MDAITEHGKSRSGFRLGRRLGLGHGLALGLVALTMFGAPALMARAQDATPVPSGTVPNYYAPASTIFVSGRGTVKTEPDTASVTIGIDVLESDLAEAQASATSQATAIIDAVTAAGVAEDDIQTSNFSVNILRDYDDQGNPGPITGYQITNQINVTVRALDSLGGLLDDAVAAGANNIYGIVFYVEDTDAAASQARAQAMADAQRKAEELASAAGLTLTRATSISESYAPSPMPVDFGGSGMAESRMMDAAAAPVPVQAGTTDVIVDVQVTYEAR